MQQENVNNHDHICKQHYHQRIVLYSCLSSRSSYLHERFPNTSWVFRKLLYFKGKFVRIDLIRDLPLIVQVIEKEFLNFRITKLEKVETESIEFNKKFKTYATSKQDAFYVLTPQIQEKLLELEKKFPGTIQYSFQNGYLYTYINSSQNEFEINFSKPIDEKLISRIKTEATLPCMIINEFRLDQDKWTNKDR